MDLAQPMRPIAPFAFPPSRPRRAAALAVALVLAASGSAEARPSGAVTGTVTVQLKGLFGKKAKRDRSGVVVYLEQVPPPARPPAAAPTLQLRQRDKAFKPGVIAVAKGASVEFPNDDKIFHNVFSLSKAAKFDLGLYKSGTSRTVSFSRPGTVDVYCNIHPEMNATIKVMETPYFAVTDKDGRFRIGDVPPGTYPIVGWQARGEPWRGRITIGAGKATRIDFALTEGQEPPRHLRKDGTPYGRYQ